MNPVKDLFNRIDIDPEEMKPMATLVIRFSGKGLSHVGNAMAEALDLCVEKVPENATYRGWVMVDTKQTARNNTPLKGKGLQFLKDSLATLPKMPDRPESASKKNSGSTAFAIHIKDGEPKGTLPERFGLYFSLLDNPQNSFATTKGFLMMGLSLETLQEPSEWFSLTEKLMAILKAEVAWLSPGLWAIPGHLIMHYVTQDPNTLITLLGKDPQIDLPYLYASRATFPALPGYFKPDPFSGYLSPAWALWAHSPLARKIEKFPGLRTELKSGGARFLLSEEMPFEMTDAVYAEWKKNWQALSKLHVTCRDIEENIDQYFIKRFDADKFSNLESGWKKERKALEDKKEHQSKLLNELNTLIKARDQKLFGKAEEIKDQVSVRLLLWDLIPALGELAKDGKADAPTISKWLEFTEKNAIEVGGQTIESAAATAAASNLPELAIRLLKSFDWEKEIAAIYRIKKDRRFKSVVGNREFIAILNKYASTKK